MAENDDAIREQVARWAADRRNRVLIELGDRVRNDLLVENSASLEWRAGLVAGRAWNALARAGRIYG